MRLLEGAGASVTGAWFELPSPRHVWKSHLRTLYVSGDFGTGTVGIEITPDDPTASPVAFDVPNADAIAAKVVMNIEFRAQAIRAVTTTNVVSLTVDFE